ncbi:glycosyltransferase family 32 protein [Flagellimonas pacifica]|uniref:Alpha 1,4-glycosyltransferase conserved region n=1 Tax=Flagellimonas pacifica TaxID=1247520 RepID=A0A285MUA6_9FLAO|nr:glycosyltransferase [Allomuricauda parva]SNZ00283.1 Alpha 1,4-glycosyltransferase conserved region [Allomuricauda parva]
MIPKKIHFCWYGHGPYNDTINKCIASWKTKLPDYTIKKWDETNTPFDKFPFLRILYKQKKWSFITDYMRLYSIYTEGGIYLDTDIEILKDFGKLLEEEAFVGYQTTLEESKYPFNSAVVGSTPKNLFIKECIKETERKQRLKYNAMGGPPIVSKVLIQDYGVNQYKDQTINGVKLLTKDYFFPFSWMEEYSPECITENTVCIHWWEESWTVKKKNLSYYVDSVKRKLQKTPTILGNRLKYNINEKGFYLTDFQ